MSKVELFIQNAVIWGLFALMSYPCLSVVYLLIKGV